jgi:parallel beta-helix repeat protein
MSRVQIDGFAATIGSSGSTYIADPANADVTIEAALAAYDVVFVRSGTYTLSNPIDMPSGKTLLGQPGLRPTLQMTAGTNKTVITNANASTGGMTTGVTIRSLIIDQQGALQTAGGGIVATGIQGWVLDEIVIKKSYRFNFLCLHQSTGISNNTGTVTFTKDSATVTGSGTLFTTQLAVGSIIKSAGNQFARVLSIESNTSLTTTIVWGYTTETGVTYKTILPNSGCTFSRMRFEGTVLDADASGYGFFDGGTVRDSEAYGANTGGCGFVPDHARSMTLTNLVSHENDNSGISLETCEDCTITNCTTYGNVGGNGIQLISGTSRTTVTSCVARNHTFNGFSVQYNTTSAGIPRSNVFTSCAGYLNGGYGFRNDGGLATEYNLVTGYNNDTGGLIVNTSNSSVPDDVNIHNSEFYDNRGGAKSQDRGIWIVAATDTIVANNTALDSLHTVAGIVNTGTNTTLSNNTT